METFSRKMQAGAVWTLLARFMEQSLGIVSTIILARLLVPDDFGVVAMAMSIAVAMELFSAFSFDTALIQNQKAQRRHYDTAWTLNVAFGIFTSVLLLLLAVPAAHFYKEPRLDAVMFVLALVPFLGGVENIGVVAFQKELDFNKEFRFVLGKKLTGFLTCVTLAFVWKNYWALVAGMLTSRVVGTAMSYWLHPYRPRFALAAARELVQFSKWLLINNFLSFLMLRSADFVIGRLSGAHSLGFYNIANQISSLPTTHFVAPINRAVYPAYSKMSADLGMLRQNFINVISIIVMFVLPAAAGISVIAELMVEVFLGPRWSDAAILMQILAFSAAITAMETNMVFVFLALGTPRTYTWLFGLTAVVLLPLLVWLTQALGTVGAALAHLLTSVVLFPVFYTTACHKLRLKSSQLLSAVWRPVVSTSIMYAVVNSYVRYLLDGLVFSSRELALAGAVVLGASVYAGTLLALWYASSKPAGPEEFVVGKLAVTMGQLKRMRSSVWG